MNRKAISLMLMGIFLIFSLIFNLFIIEEEVAKTTRGKFMKKRPFLVKGSVTTAIDTFEAFRKSKKSSLVVASAAYPNKQIDISWLKAAAPVYQISDDIKDYIRLTSIEHSQSLRFPPEITSASSRIFDRDQIIRDLTNYN